MEKKIVRPAREFIAPSDQKTKTQRAFDRIVKELDDWACNGTDEGDFLYWAFTLVASSKLMRDGKARRQAGTENVYQEEEEFDG